MAIPRTVSTRPFCSRTIVAVALFMVATALISVAAFSPSLLRLIAGIVGPVLFVAIQAHGHSLEPVPSDPFTGPANFLGRLLIEQWVTFPRFVLSGGWWANRPDGSMLGRRRGSLVFVVTVAVVLAPRRSAADRREPRA